MPGLASEPRFGKVLKVAGSLKCERLLDIGCGDGTFTLRLKEALKAGEAVGIDIASEAVSAAKEKGIQAYQLDIDKNALPFGDASFDVVYCGEIIEHIFNPDHLLEEVHRVLKAGGSAIFTTPNLAGWSNRLALLLGYQPFPTAVSLQHQGVGKMFNAGGEGGHIRVFTARALKQMLVIHRFKVVRLIGCSGRLKSSSLKMFSQLITLLDKAMSGIPSFANHVIALVEKG